MEHKIFGCKVNKYYTDKWLNSKHLKDKSGAFVASCVVTDKAKRKWIKFVKDSIKKLDTKGKIYISGCGAFDKANIDKGFFDKYPELKEFKNKIEVLPEDPKQLNKNDLAEISNKLRGIYTKKFIVIQNGCDSFCSFCLTVKKRGKHYSKPKEEILKETKDFENIGGKEVVLTGVNLCAWGQETTNDFKNPRFKELLKYILENTKIPRIRISSLGPEFLDSEIIELFKNTRIYPHFHFSLQSGSDKILKSMGRHYSKTHLENILGQLKNLKRDDNIEISIGADIILGFPGETEEDFMDTYNIVKNYKITKLHAFPFSAHKLADDVPAGIYPNQVDEKIKKDRVNKLIQLGDKLRDDFINSQKGKQFEVLVEVIREGKFKGWTQNYIEVNNDNFEIISGNIKKNEIVIGKLK